MIVIQDLTGKFPEKIVDLILDQGSQPIEISIPKSTVLFSSETREIAIDYGFLAYSGQLIFDAVDSFEYDEIPPEVHESVLFTVYVKDVEALAEALFKVSFGYVNDVDDEIYGEEHGFEFHMWADQFLSDVEEGKIEAACPYFYEIYSEFIEKEEEDEEANA